MLSRRDFLTGASLLVLTGVADAASGNKLRLRNHMFSTSNFDYYVDSVNGSDSNPGTQASPFQTIGKVNGLGSMTGKRIGFKSGSYFTDAILTPQADGMGFYKYGNGANPVFCANDFKTWAQGSVAQETGGTFASGMETAAFSDWTSIDTTGVQSVTRVGNSFPNNPSPSPAHGSWCMKLTANAAATDNRGGLKNTIAALVNNTTYYFRSYVYIPSGSLGAGTQLKFMTMSAAPTYISINWNGSALTGITSTNRGSSFTATTALMKLDTWFCVEWAYVVSATVGGSQVWVNGTSIGSSFIYDTHLDAGQTSFELGNSGFSAILASKQSVYFDDCKIDTSPIGTFAGQSTSVWSCTSGNPLFPAFGAVPTIGASANLPALTLPYQYFWDGATTVYVYSQSDPTSTVSIPSRSNAMSIVGRQYITVDQGLTFRGGTTNAINCTGDCSNIDVQATMELAFIDGFRILENTAGVNNGKIRNAVAQNNGSSGLNINVSSFQNWLITNNQLLFNAQIPNGFDVDHTFMAGFKCFSQAQNVSPHTAVPTAGTGTVISYNTAIGNGRNSTISGGQVGWGVGIWSDICCGLEIAYNISHDNFAHGVFLEKNFNGHVHHNVSYNNGLTGQVAFTGNIAVSVSDGNDCGNNELDHNTSYGGYWGLSCNAYEGAGQSQLNTQNWHDNIGSGATSQNFYAGPGANNDTTNGTGNVYAYNNFGAAASNFALWSPTLYSTYAALIAASSGAITHSVQGNPLFENVALGDFRLQPASPCVGTASDGGNVGALGVGP